MHNEVKKDWPLLYSEDVTEIKVDRAKQRICVNGQPNGTGIDSKKKNPIKNKKLPKVIVAHVLKGHGKEKIFPINLEIFLLPFVF